MTACTSDRDAEFDWQGHRGARGLLPENTIPAFKKAMELGVNTLELDVVVTADSQIIISHEPWLSHHICRMPDGSDITEDTARSLNIYQMTAAEVQRYDCGTLPQARFPDQKQMPASKPLLSEMVEAVEILADQQGCAAPRYNIEIKSLPEGYDIYVPRPQVFVRLLLNELSKLGIAARTSVQSFDVNVLNELHRQAPDQTSVYLVESTDDIPASLALLEFTPDIYSPYYVGLTREKVADLQARGMRVIPWTVNEVTEMQEMRDIGVDGLITDYPNRIADVEGR